MIQPSFQRTNIKSLSRHTHRLCPLRVLYFWHSGRLVCHGFEREIGAKRVPVLWQNSPNFMCKLSLFAAAWVCGFALFAV